MPHPRRSHGQAAAQLARVAPVVGRWIERLLAAHDPPLTPAQLLALRAAAVADVAGAELARRAGVSAAAVSQLVAGLESSGLVVREAAGADRRRLELRLTPRGTSVLASAETALRERLAALLAELPPPEAEALARSLERVEALLTGE